MFSNDKKELFHSENLSLEFVLYLKRVEMPENDQITSLFKFYENSPVPFNVYRFDKDLN